MLCCFARRSLHRLAVRTRKLREAEHVITTMTGELELLRSIVDDQSPGLSDRIRQASETLTQILEGASHEHSDCDSHE